MTVLYGLRDKVARMRFASACAGILDTPPARLGAASELTLFTQLQHKDVLLALLAFKSFAARVPVGRFRILNDGSLDDDDRALLARHLPGVRFLALDDVRSAACPRGGTWERLLWIARLSREGYVVQLDSDTLALGALPEVQAAIDAGRPFVIGTWDDQEVETMAERRAAAVARLAGTADGHVQLLAESRLDAIPGHERLRYVRGCSGFAGFARGSVDLGFVESASRALGAALGAAWQRWGSEQVMSNIVVANAAGTVVLPHPKYCDCTRHRAGTTAFVHFIGSCRFAGTLYRDEARRVIDSLAAEAVR